MERSGMPESEFGSAGWISMCDVYLLFSALIVALCFGIGSVAERLGLEKRDGDRLIAALGSERDSLKAQRDTLNAELTHFENGAEQLHEARSQVDTLNAEIARLQPIED